MSRCAVWRLLAWLALTPFAFADRASAQLPQLSELSARVGKEIKPLRPHLVAVVDFRSAKGSVTPQGHYLAWLLSTLLQDQEKKKFVIADHVRFDGDLAKLHLTAETLLPGDSLRAAAPDIGADLLITGSLEKRGNAYILQIVPVRVRNSEALSPITATIDSNEFFESMLTPFPSDVLFLNSRAIAADISMPACSYCPDPSYTDPARRAKINGTNVFQVLISSSGEARQLRPVKLLGYGLDEHAFDTIKEWKFKPATLKKDGTPVAVVVPIEVSFRLY